MKFGPNGFEKASFFCKFECLGNKPSFKPIFANLKDIYGTILKFGSFEEHRNAIYIPLVN